MSWNPLTELKRRLDEDATPLPKRLCLAKNIIQSNYFPTAPKERIVGLWLLTLTQNNSLSSTELRNVLLWLNDCDELTSELKIHLVKIVSQYVQKTLLQKNDMHNIVMFLENPKISNQLSHQIDDYLTIVVALLQSLRGEFVTDVTVCNRIFDNMTKYYKECKKKLEFIIKILQEGNLETLFSYLDTDCRKNVIDVFKNILFPISKKTFYISYLQTLIRKDNIDELIAEKGDNIQSVLKIMNALFEFSKYRSEKNEKFIRDFIDVFVYSFRSESQIIFAFYIMVANFLNMPQKYIIPAMNITPLNFDNNDEKVKRNLFLNMLEILLENEADISVRLTDTFGEKISKVEIKKNFMSFLQVVMMGQLKLQGKLDKTTLEIIKTSLKLDPMLIEQKMNDILPPIMAAKKNNSKIKSSYTEMMNCHLEILFKLSRGTLFLNNILPFVKTILEACNTEQFELKQMLQQSTDAGNIDDKLRNKIITGNDILPDECVEMYGKLTCELMFRQNKELLETFQKNFDEHCLMMLEEGFVSPSIITLAEVLSAILSSFFRHNKMADHAVPLQIAQDFWNAYNKFENECIKKFGECILKLSYNPPLIKSFLKLCLGYSQLKLLNMNYSTIKIDITNTIDSDIFDFTVLVPCFTKQQWIDLTSNVKDDEIVLILNNLLIVKTMAMELMSIKNESVNTDVHLTKTHLIKDLSSNPDVLNNTDYYTTAFFDNLDKSQYKQVAKSLFKMYLNNLETGVFKTEVIVNNRMLINALVLETAKNITKCFENCESLTKSLSKQDFTMASFAKENNMKDYFEGIKMTENHEIIKHSLDLIQKLQVPYLEENYQLVIIFLLLAIKKYCQVKKVRRQADNILQSIYELSLQPPDLYQIFPVEYIFSFDDDKMLNLLTLTIKTSNNMLVIRNMLESAVKRVRTDSNIVKNIVKIILSNKITDCIGIDVFNNSVFQIICLILPLIVKQKKAITASVHRSILAELQEQLQRKLVLSFKNIDFSAYGKAGNTDDTMVETETNMATLKAMAAYSLTLSKFFETNDDDEIKNLSFAWDSLEFFVQNALQCIKNPVSKPQHVEASLQLLNIPLRHIKKIEMHDLFKNRDEMFVKIWRSVKSRLIIMYENRRVNVEEMAVTLKYLCELSSVDCFVATFVGDLTTLVVLEKPADIIKEAFNSNKISLNVAKYVWSQCLKANIVGPKCVALTKLMHRTCMNLGFWIRQHYEINYIPTKKRKKVKLYTEDEFSHKVFKIDDKICEYLKIYLDMLTELIFASKKMSIDYKFIDSVFCLQHMYHYILGDKRDNVSCELSWTAFFELYNACVGVLNGLLAARKEMLEDRWPCYMQCYRVLVTLLCEKSTSMVKLEKTVEDRLAETAHNVEKLTQSISKQKKQVSRIAAYTVGDICSLLERTTPTRMVRKHLENSIVLLVQASDNTYAMAFLKRALAGSAGHMTMTNMYNVYKKYHKYVGNA
ncbi:hypothetical protein O3G_MSEX010759 [Manduca sexta]|uniref:Nucleolar 27S pre-rRNA processing Urb2/Npa2 C-terminal domain-containing protein n=1 Tax=Manduca sexta TaxID=7130 RepID=A0A922CU45_MANSE|nr:hypothetical protein O3G_MSEX010759 [Manduca sexta]